MVFLNSKRRWLFNAVEDCRSQHSSKLPQHYLSGTKVMYRGRRLMLQIESADVEQVIIACRSRFLIQVPYQLAGDEREDAIEQALTHWKRDRAWQDIQYFTKVYARKLGVQLPPVKLSEQKRVWGTCSKDGVIPYQLAVS
nr:YgjP-like metallopeptidase domain-containing protein [Nostoc sp. NMS7]